MQYYYYVFDLYAKEEHPSFIDSFTARSWREMENAMAKTAIVTGASRGIGRSIAKRPVGWSAMRECKILMLHKLGIELVRLLRGGFNERKRVGYPLEPVSRCNSFRPRYAVCRLKVSLLTRTESDDSRRRIAKDTGVR